MDRKLFILISLISITIVLIFGDALYVGLWYYIVIPLVAFLLTLPFKPHQLFLTGISLVIQLTLITYLYINLTTERPEGLLALGHLFSLPGLAIGIIAASIYVKNKSKNKYIMLAIGFSGAALGFVINQLIICNTFIYCGKFVSPLINT